VTLIFLPSCVHFYDSAGGAYKVWHGHMYREHLQIIQWLKCRCWCGQYPELTVTLTATSSPYFALSTDSNSTIYRRPSTGCIKT